MKIYDITMSTSTAYKIAIKATSEEEAWDKANGLCSDEIEKQCYDSWQVDGFPMVVEIKE
jgi:hypothetical protein